MSIATRVTLLTVLLLVLALSLFGVLTLRTRRAELDADLEQKTRLFASALTVSLEGAIQDGLYEDVRGLIQRMQTTEQTIDVVYLDFLHPADSAAFGPHAGPGEARAGQGRDAAAGERAASYRPPLPEPTRDERLRRVQITGQPVGQYVAVAGREVYAYMFPLRGTQHQMVAAVDLVRNQSEVEQELARSTREVVLTLGSLCALLILLISLTVRQQFSGPLLRLVDGIDEVSRGDYTGALLRERNDEVGLLADRFNEMTRSLRKAREEILTGVDAKLQLETRLRHSDKLATIGQLAAGIAHEVGTPLNVIGGRARVMARRAEDPQAVQKNAEIIATQAERITKIIQQLLDYARRKAPARALVDLRHVASTTLDFLELQLSTRGVTATLHPFAVSAPPLRTAELGGALILPPAGPPGSEPSGELQRPPPAPQVVGDADQLQQVCLNLCINAIQAMPDGGHLDLHLEGLVRRKPGLDRASPGAYVMLAVADTGVGIAEEHVSRIFEPFYSTKTLDEQSNPGERAAAVGGGSGLGLSVSAGIVKDHDGWIEIERRPGPPGGTIFRVFLPAPEGDEAALVGAAGDRASRPAGVPRPPPNALPPAAEDVVETQEPRT